MKVVKVDNCITFEDGTILDSEHVQNCCESHFLSFDDLTLEDFDGLEFDLSTEDFFERIEDYGIALKPTNGFPIRIPGYGSNNGYYSSHLDLVLLNRKFNVCKRFNISDCQVIDG